ncbi:hypothetical protein FRC14_002808 [Serendipita sp. 396]|nr:hypothetical protein FRC14_002808 [Serendipita sp. 396]KAG8854352.1 hypothetical protein FRB91_003635 [Serendipita sp. 411]
MSKNANQPLNVDKSGLDAISGLPFLAQSSSSSLPFGTTFGSAFDSGVNNASNTIPGASMGLSTFTGGVSGLPLNIPPNQPAPGTPAAEFRANIDIALSQHLPQLISLAESVVSGIDRAYEPDVNPNKVANDYATLVSMTSQFYEFINQTGIGALPMVDPPEKTTGDANDMNVDVVAPPPFSTMSEDELHGILNDIVNAKYQRHRRIADNAAIVISRLGSKHAP